MPEIEHIEALIHTKTTKPNCDACDANAWRVSNEEHFLGSIRDGQIHLTDGMPLYAAVCTNCGLVRFYSSLILK